MLPTLTGFLSTDGQLAALIIPTAEQKVKKLDREVSQAQMQVNTAKRAFASKEDVLSNLVTTRDREGAMLETLKIKKGGL